MERRRTAIWIGLLAAALVIGSLVSQAFTAAFPAANTVRIDTAQLPLSVSGTTSPASASCKTVGVNLQGVANVGIVVDATAGGVTVLAASTTRCGALLYNLQSGGDILCAPTTVTVTTTKGFYLPAGQSLELTEEAQQAWKCIRQGGTSGTLYVAEKTT